MKWTKSIISFIRKNYNLMIGERTSETIKMEIGSAGEPEGIENMEIRGRDLLTGLPKTIEITAKEISSHYAIRFMPLSKQSKTRLKKHHRNLPQILWIGELS